MVVLVISGTPRIRAAIECVTVTYGIFLVAVHLPALANLVERMDAIKAYRASLNQKGVALGEDMHQRLFEFEKPDCSFLKA